MSYQELGPYVDKDNCNCVHCAVKNSRYVLDIPFVNKEGDKVIVIMLNPSSSAKANVFYGVPFSKLTDIDGTTNNVLSILAKGIYLGEAKRNIKRVVILNLFPYFSPNPKDINVIDLWNAVENQVNLKIIKTCLTDCNDSIVLVGWGMGGIGGIDRSIHKSAIGKIKDILKNNHPQNCFYYDNQTAGFEVFDPFGKRFYVTHAKNWR